MDVHPGERVALRDRPWRVVKVTPVGIGCYLLGLEALDGDDPRELQVAVPPETVHPLPPEEPEFRLD